MSGSIEADPDPLIKSATIKSKHIAEEKAKNKTYKF